MKKVILILLLLCSIKIVANVDAGSAYRFYGKIILKEKTVVGYFYLYSYQQYKENSSVLSFYKEEHKKEIIVYPSIKTISIYQNYDLAIESSGIDIKIKDIQRIVPLEVMSFVPDERLILLNKQEYSIITCSNKINIESINLGGEQISENCYDFIISEKNKSNLKKEAQELIKELKTKLNELANNIEGENGEQYFNFFKKKRKELAERGILLISACEAL